MSLMLNKIIISLYGNGMVLLESTSLKNTHFHYAWGIMKIFFEKHGFKELKMVSDPCVLALSNGGFTMSCSLTIVWTILWTFEWSYDPLNDPLYVWTILWMILNMKVAWSFERLWDYWYYSTPWTLDRTMIVSCIFWVVQLVVFVVSIIQ